jgi:hypothetical protein
MNTTTLRVAKYAGAGLAGITASCVLAAPALAMRPDPIPGSGHTQVSPPPAEPASPQGGTASDGLDWSTLGAGVGGGAMLTGIVVVGVAQLRRRQPRPA